MMKLKHYHTFLKKQNESFRRNSPKYIKKEGKLRFVTFPDQKLCVNEICWKGERDRGMDLRSKASIFLWMILPLVVFHLYFQSLVTPIHNSIVPTTQLLAKKSKKQRKPRISRIISTPSLPSIKNPQRFELKKGNAVAVSSLDILVDSCSICRNEIMELCIECQAKWESLSIEECPLVWGV